MAFERERRIRWLAIISLPVLIAAAVGINAWRNIGDYRHGIEIDVAQGASELDYGGAAWRLEQARLIGDGRDTDVQLPGEMRLIIVRLAATAIDDIGEGWGECSVSLTDEAGRRWLPLDVVLSDDLSRDLDPVAEPLDGCGISSLDPPARHQSTVIEEKFVVPATAASELLVHLSFGALRPAAIAFPLGLS
ncbi:hypothetical protein VW35_03305 [Devosia soli]|uniref:Uncharacterized protein n=1 Tax=Devosia soli TaxID=361041 RepID=A0A0F5LHY9_9HYPH|nr:hypothetical protein [Devosia soli]KKB81182.1 hypothetical protein VW35_03305 [Devosia soli]